MQSIYNYNEENMNLELDKFFEDIKQSAKKIKLFINFNSNAGNCEYSEKEFKQPEIIRAKQTRIKTFIKTFKGPRNDKTIF